MTTADKVIELSEKLDSLPWELAELSDEFFLETNHKWAIAGGLTGRIAKVEGLGEPSEAIAAYIVAACNHAPALARDAQKLQRVRDFADGMAKRGKRPLRDQPANVSEVYKQVARELLVLLTPQTDGKG